MSSTVNPLDGLAAAMAAAEAAASPNPSLAASPTTAELARRTNVISPTSVARSLSTADLVALSEIMRVTMDGNGAIARRWAGVRRHRRTFTGAAAATWLHRWLARTVHERCASTGAAMQGMHAAEPSVLQNATLTVGQRLMEANSFYCVTPPVDGDTSSSPTVDADAASLSSARGDARFHATRVAVAGAGGVALFEGKRLYRFFTDDASAFESDAGGGSRARSNSGIDGSSSSSEPRRPSGSPTGGGGGGGGGNSAFRRSPRRLSGGVGGAGSGLAAARAAPSSWHDLAAEPVVGEPLLSALGRRFEGYLHKRGAKRAGVDQSWSRRWCVLSGNLFVWFQDESELVVCGAIEFHAFHQPSIDGEFISFHANMSEYFTNLMISDYYLFSFRFSFYHITEYLANLMPIFVDYYLHPQVLRLRQSTSWRWLHISRAR